ncbi:MAG: NCS2 family permease [Erysipelotrichaceae bacterium]|nr:NCS2 family permease [Erysipelotrichaceae bacterium]
MERFFKLSERGTTVKIEFIAGMTSFFAMVYILMVNATMFANPFGDGSNPLGVSYGAIYIATAISAIVSTTAAGLISNLPLVMASGMGLNAFFVYTVCLGFGLSYANALVLILAEGLIFILLTVTGLRKKIFESLPDAVRVAIPGGIGLFIALLGLQNAGLVVPNSSTCVDLGSFNLLTQDWCTIMPMVVTLCTFLAIVIMSRKNIRGAVLIGILGGMGLYYLLGLTVDGFYSTFEITLVSPVQAFSEFTSQSLFMVFKKGLDFSDYIEVHGSANLMLTIFTTALAFCMVDMFDTLGTLYAACERAGLMDENGDPVNMNGGMLSDAIGTTIGAICGTSTVTTFSEVNAGVAAGGRTGLTSVFCGLGFFIAMFLSPIAQLVPSCTTAAALIYVGFLMLVSVKSVDWDDLKVAIPSFLTLIMMPFTYNISYGIAFGLISYIIINVFLGDIKKIKGSSWVIGVLFIAMLLLTH